MEEVSEKNVRLLRTEERRKIEGEWKKEDIMWQDNGICEIHVQNLPSCTLHFLEEMWVRNLDIL